MMDGDPGSFLPPPEIELAGLLAQVRAELARRDAAAQAPCLVPAPAGPRPEADWDQLTKLLAETEPFADAGATVPELRRWPQPLRWLGRLAASCVLFALRVVTSRQRRFNHGTHESVRRLLEIVRQADLAQGQANALLQHCLEQQAFLQHRLLPAADHGRAIRVHDDRLQQLQGIFRRLHVQFDELEARLVRLEGPAGHSRRGSAA